MKRVTCPTCDGKGFEMVWTAREAEIESILYEAADAFGVSVADIRGRSRTVPVVRARDHAMRRLRAMGLLLKEIGRETGGRSHSTIIHALQKQATA